MDRFPLNSALMNRRESSKRHVLNCRFLDEIEEQEQLEHPCVVCGEFEAEESGLCKCCTLGADEFVEAFAGANEMPERKPAGREVQYREVA